MSILGNPMRSSIQCSATLLAAVCILVLQGCGSGKFEPGAFRLDVERSEAQIPDFTNFNLIVFADGTVSTTGFKVHDGNWKQTSEGIVVHLKYPGNVFRALEGTLETDPNGPVDMHFEIRNSNEIVWIPAIYAKYKKVKIVFVRKH